MDKDQFDGLIAFKVVAEKKSFTEAARALKVSGAAASKMISQLEKKMGVSLFTRTTRTVSMTEAGTSFLKEIGPAIDHIITSQENLKSLAHKPSGTLRINIPGAIYPAFFASFVKKFCEKYPDIKVELYASDQASDIFEDGFDAGIRVSDILAKDMVAVKIQGPVRFVTVASPDYLKRRGQPTHPKDLLTHDCIRLRFGAGENIYDKWEFEDKGREFEVRVNGSLILNDSLLMRHAALEGAGIIYTIYDLIEPDLKTKRLALVLKKFHVSSGGYYLYFPKRSQVAPKLRAFIDELKR